MFFDYAWAEAAAAPQPSIMEYALPIICGFFIIYVMIIRPSQKKQQNHQTLLTGLKRGDSVLTNGGILGTIEGITEQFIILEIAAGVRIRILKNQISGPVPQDEKKEVKK